REAFLASSRGAVIEARRAAGCRDFVVAADPIDPDRVNVYEEWDSDTQLEAFRGAGPGAGTDPSHRTCRRFLPPRGFLGPGLISPVYTSDRRTSRSSGPRLASA